MSALAPAIASMKRAGTPSGAKTPPLKKAKAADGAPGPSSSGDALAAAQAAPARPSTSKKAAAGSAARGKAAATPRTNGKAPMPDTPASFAMSPLGTVGKDNGKAAKEAAKALKPRHLSLIKYLEKMKKGLGALLNALAHEETLGVRAQLVALTKERARAQAAERALERRVERDKVREQAKAWAELQKRYPIDDALLHLEPPLEKPLPARPAPRLRLALSPWEQSLAAELLCVWDFLSSFAKHLGVEPVDVESLRLALHPTAAPLALLSEVHLPLLALVLDEAGAVQTQGAAQARGLQGLEQPAAVLPWALALMPPGPAEPAAAAAAVVADGKAARPTRGGGGGGDDGGGAQPQPPPPLFVGAASALALSVLGWPEVLRCTLLALVQPPPPAGSALALALHALGVCEYETLPFAAKLALLRALADAAASTEAISTLTAAHAEMRAEIIAEHRKELTAHARLADDAAARPSRAAAAAATGGGGGGGAVPRRPAGAAAAAAAGAGATAAAARPRAKRPKAAEGGGRVKGKGRAAAAAAAGGEETAADDAAADAAADEAMADTDAAAADGEGGGAAGADVVRVCAAPPLDEGSDDDDDMSAGAEAEARAAEDAADVAADEADDALGLTRTERMKRKEQRLQLVRQARALREARRKRKTARGDAAARRADAVQALERALALNELEALEGALERARAAQLEWRDPSDGALCRVELLQSAERAYLPLRRLDELEAVTRQLEGTLAELPVRTIPLGEDAERRRYWLFPAEPSRLYVEGDDAAAAAHAAAAGGRAKGAKGKAAATAAAATAARSWGYLESMQEVRALIDSLDSRGVRERALRLALRRSLGVLKGAMAAAPALSAPPPGAEEAGWRSEGPHVGARALRLFDDSASAATVSRYLPPSAGPPAEPGLWHLTHDDGDEEDADAAELAQALEAAARARAEPTALPLPRALAAYANQLARVRIAPKAALGLAAARAELFAAEAALGPALRARGAAWGEGELEARGCWLDAVAAAASPPALGAQLLALEAVARGTQTLDDAADDGGEAGAGEEEGGERFRRSGSGYLGQPIRRFFRSGASDGVVDGWLPHADDGAAAAAAASDATDGGGVALWHATHDDGDEEELEEWEVLEAIRAHAEAATEPLDDAARAACVAKANGNAADAKAAAHAAAAEAAALAARAHERIWPTAEARARWIRAVSGARTCAQVSVGCMSLLDHCVRARVGSHSAEVCKLSWMPTFAASGAQAEQQLSKDLHATAAAEHKAAPRKARLPSELVERLTCWQHTSRRALADAEARAATLRRKRGHKVAMTSLTVSGAAAETVGRLRELFVPAGFMLLPPPAQP